MELIGVSISDHERKPNSVRKWYDKRTRCWVVQLLDDEENQIDEAYYCHSKEDAVKEEKRLKDEHGIA